MNEPVILSACRTPIGKMHGVLDGLTATELGAAAIRAAVQRAGVSVDQIDEVVMGNVLPAGLGQAPARQAALMAGLPPSVAAVTINKMCGSGLKAVMLAGQAIRAGDAEVVVAGGMESMSRAPYLLNRQDAKLGDRTLTDSLMRDGLVCSLTGEGMGQIAEKLADDDGISRADQDRYAVESHRRAVSAAAEGRFAAELTPVVVPSRGEQCTVDRDEGPRADATLESLAKLRPAFDRDGTVTAGNASMISDGAAALVVASRRFADSHGLAPLARLVAYATAGGPPQKLFTAPVDAVRLTLDRAERSADEVDLWEINEAFAAQMLACVRRLEIPTERVNIGGGAIALGHPIGASGARVTVSLVHAMRRENAASGVAALCLGGGNAVAALLERV